MPKKLIQDISIGPTIKKLRKAKNLTQEQVAAQVYAKGRPMSRSVYSKIETGKSNIRISELIALKEIFGVEYADFFADLP